MAQDPERTVMTPAGMSHPRLIRPKAIYIAAGRGQKETRLAAIAEQQAFRAAHREAKRRWMDGDREVVFPAGTYWCAFTTAPR